MNIKVSLGNPKPPVPGKKCTVPNVVNQTLAAAAKAIAQGQLQGGQDQHRQVQEGQGREGHLEQSEGRRQESSGAKVDLTISKGNKKPKKKK